MNLFIKLNPHRGANTAATCRYLSRGGQIPLTTNLDLAPNENESAAFDYHTRFSGKAGGREAYLLIVSLPLSGELGEYRETPAALYDTLVSGWLNSDPELKHHRHVSVVHLSDREGRPTKPHAHILLSAVNERTGRALHFGRDGRELAALKDGWAKHCEAFGFTISRGRAGRRSPNIRDLKMTARGEGQKAALERLIRKHTSPLWQNVKEGLHREGVTVHRNKKGSLTFTMQTPRGLRRFSLDRLPGLTDEEKANLKLLPLQITGLPRPRRRMRCRPCVAFMAAKLSRDIVHDAEIQTAIRQRRRDRIEAWLSERNQWRWLDELFRAREELGQFDWIDELMDAVFHVKRERRFGL